MQNQHDAHKAAHVYAREANDAARRYESKYPRYSTRPMTIWRHVGLGLRNAFLIIGFGAILVALVLNAWNPPTSGINAPQPPIVATPTAIMQQFPATIGQAFIV